MKKIDWRLCLVADMEAAGKNCNTREFLDLAVQIADLLKPKGIPLIINSRADISLACEADGLHLGQQDIPLVFTRKILGQNRLIGISVNTNEEAQPAEKAGADYIGVGPVYFTSSKDELPNILGLEGFRSIRKKSTFRSWLLAVCRLKTLAP